MRRLRHALSPCALLLLVLAAAVAADSGALLRLAGCRSFRALPPRPLTPHRGAAPEPGGRSRAPALGGAGGAQRGGSRRRPLLDVPPRRPRALLASRPAGDTAAASATADAAAAAAAAAGGPGAAPSPPPPPPAAADLERLYCSAPGRYSLSNGGFEVGWTPAAQLGGAEMLFGQAAGVAGPRGAAECAPAAAARAPGAGCADVLTY